MNKFNLPALVCLVLLLSSSAKAQFSMTGLTGNYTQDFNTLLNTGTATWTDNTTLPNWYAQRSGTGTGIAADAGTGTAGNLYSYGSTAAADRSIGSLGSGGATSGDFAWGVLMQNNTGATLTSLNIAYTGEQWRNSAASAQSITLWYKISSSAITALNPNANATWTQITGIDFTSPISGGTAGALDGNLAANRSSLTGNSGAISLAPGDFIMIKWEDPNHTASDHGLSIDDVDISWSATAPCTPPATQVTNFASSNITNTTADISWTAGSGTNTIVLIHQSVAVNADPSSSVSYTGNANFGSGSQIGVGNYVVYDGTGTSFTVTGLSPGTNYYFAVYTYDPNGGSPCYLTTELTGSITTTGSPSTCFEIESILVDGCDGGNEGMNEMVRFKVGSTALNVADLTVNWPNNTFLGMCQNATTASAVATINTTILACGYVLEPTGGILPAGAEVIMVTSTAFNPLAQSFVNLNDTIYMIFQCAGNTAGHFVNYSSTSSIRTLTMTFSSPASCSDAVSYDRSLLTMQNGNIGAQDGGAVEFLADGTASYINRGCQAPFVPLTVNAGNDASVCFNGTVNLSGTGSAQYSSVVWSGGTGTFGTPNSFNTTYTPGPGETGGSVVLTLQLNSNCSTFITDSVTITINPAPIPAITSNDPNDTVCAGSPITLTATGGTSYLWDNTATTNTITVSPTVSTVYTVTATNSCSSTPATFSVSVNDLPIVAATNTGDYCLGQNIQLDASPGYTYSWSGPLSFSGAIQNPVITNSTLSHAGTYTVTVTDANGCSSNATTSVIVNALPSITSVTPPVTITDASCGNSDGSIIGATASGTNPISYQWYSSSGTPLVTTSDISGLTAGSYYFAAIDGNGCRDSVQFTVSVLNGPATPAFVANPSVCSGSSFTLTVSNPLSGATYTWSAPGVTTQTGVDLITITIPSADATNVGPYSVEVNDGACSNFGSVSATLIQTPSPTVIGGVSFCQGDSTILDATASLPVGSTFQWYESGNIISGETNSTLSVTTAGNYQVMVSNAGCDSLSAATSIIVNPLPVISVNNVNVCLNDTSLLVASGALNYNWSAGTLPATGDSVMTNTSLAGTNSYTVTGTDANGCVNTAVSNVTVNSLPVVLASNMDVCLNTAAILTVSGALNYSWLGGTTPATGDTVSVPSSSAGTYTYTVIGTDANSCADTLNLIVNVNDLPAVSVNNATACLNETAQLVATGANTYSWSGATAQTIGDTVNALTSNAGTFTVTVTGTDVNNCINTANATVLVNALPNVQATNDTVCISQQAIITANGALTYSWAAGTNPSTGDTVAVNTSLVGTTTYTVTGTDANNCTNTSIATVVVNAQPLIQTVGATACQNSVVTISASGASNYIWLSGTTPLNNDTVSVSSATAGTFTYTVIGTDASGCSDTTDVQVTINALPNVTVNNDNACLNETVGLTANGASTYIWSAGTNPSNGANVSAPSNVPGTTTYTVTGTDVNNCSNTAVSTVVINSAPTVTINGIQNDSISVCENAATTLTASGAQTYVWSTSEITNPISYSATDTTTISVIGADLNGCTDTTEVTLVTNPLPIMNVAGVPTICNGLATNLFADSISGQTYSWTDQAGNVLSTDTTLHITATGTYSLSVSNTCGTISTPITIVASSIDVSFDPDTTMSVAPVTVNFTNTSSGVDNYTWIFGNGDTTATTNTALSPQVVYNTPGTYTVTLMGSNNQYCYGSYSTQIVVLETNIFITIPNVFSPNNDHINDVFYFTHYGIKDFNCKIYDRWGLLMTDLQGVDSKWVPASNVSEGTYFYIITAKGIDDKDYSSQGYLLLVR